MTIKTGTHRGFPYKAEWQTNTARIGRSIQRCSIAALPRPDAMRMGKGYQP
jgi:hypothetical protein